MLDPERCRQARLSRDARFDGQFFTAVHTTKVYCRPICPATPPQERNVCYFESAVAAAEAGFRPCLRCRPDSAPGSPAWKGVDTTLERALRLIDGGALQQGSLSELCERLGIGERYLRRLFHDRFGVSPKTYALYQQCLFAKQLLHQTDLPVTDIAYASGFRSLRRFHDAFRSRMGMNPRELRRRAAAGGSGLTLQLAYRPPYAWERLRDFLAQRAVSGLEWVGDDYYGRGFAWQGAKGHFTARHEPQYHRFTVTLELDRLASLKPVVGNIRRVLDLDADSATIEAHLAQAAPGLSLVEGLRLPGIWSQFEAGIKAILGQQVSVAAARKLAQVLVDTLGEAVDGARRRFPEPAAIAASDLAFLGMPAARRDSVRRLAEWHVTQDNDQSAQAWLPLKGIGPWTVDYARMRGASHPDIWLGGDLGVKKALSELDGADPVAASPWRSYLTFQLWNR